MMARPASFFGVVRALWRPDMDESQVEGVNTLLAAFDAWTPANMHLAPNVRWLAYILATTFHETGATMQPIAEYGKGAGKPYGKPDPVTGQIYYGRGYVQLTWRANYEKQGARLGIDLVDHPDDAMVPGVAADVLLNGMANGDFTKHKLADYFGANPAHDNPIGARAIVNGTNRAQVIASYHHTILTGLTFGGFTLATAPAAAAA